MLRTHVTRGLAAALLLVAVAGCGAQKGETIVTQGMNAAPAMQTAPQAGTYKLYTAMSPNPTTTVKLSKGDPLGFEKEGDRWVGVAGSERTVLGKGTTQAYWKLQKE
ncbi:MAG TPA: hypothetical protein VK324_15355 [Tepidisphaeraceae bacterium]|nr:hypothetical protein [Tepidisphaeraceae bacterium]